jgi:2-oxoglutarate ferredoxin oxidoreductase subunit delta
MPVDRGALQLHSEECKGCGSCVHACPLQVLRLASYLNPYGYHPVTYTGTGCTGCGICFFVCPEPGAIAVLRALERKPRPAGRAA